jgi:hypothetical protein
MTTTHSDGSICPEGTQSVPKSYTACCQVFEAHTRSCYYDIRYEWWSKARAWIIIIASSAGGGGIQIDYCPHCGANLKSTDR